MLRCALLCVDVSVVYPDKPGYIDTICITQHGVEWSEVAGGVVIVLVG